MDILNKIHPKYKGIGFIGIAVCFALSINYVNFCCWWNNNIIKYIK